MLAIAIVVVDRVSLVQKVSGTHKRGLSCMQVRMQVNCQYSAYEVISCQDSYTAGVNQKIALA